MADFDLGGLLFGNAPSSGFESYLDPEQLKRMQNQGVMQAAMALLKASGPSAVPIGIGQALGGAYEAGQAGYQQAQQQGLMGLLTKQKLDEAKRAQLAQQEEATRAKQMQDLFPQAFTSTFTPEQQTIYGTPTRVVRDDEGNLMVPDHDMINEYYEYAIKKRILENLIMNDENISPAKIQLIQEGYRAARNYALTIVNTPNFSEMKRVWTTNRRAQYAKYYDMFKSYPWYQWDKNPNDLYGDKIVR